MECKDCYPAQHTINDILHYILNIGNIVTSIKVVITMSVPSNLHCIPWLVSFLSKEQKVAAFLPFTEKKT